MRLKNIRDEPNHATPEMLKIKDTELSQHGLHSASASQGAPTDNTGWKCTVRRQMRINYVDTNTGRPSLRTKHENMCSNAI